MCLLVCCKFLLYSRAFTSDFARASLCIVGSEVCPPREIVFARTSFRRQICNRCCVDRLVFDARVAIGVRNLDVGNPVLWHLDSRFEGGHLLLGRCRVFETSSLLWRLDCSSLGCNRLVKSPIEAECFEGRLNKVLGASNGVTSSWVGALHSKRLRQCVCKYCLV